MHYSRVLVFVLAAALLVTTVHAGPFDDLDPPASVPQLVPITTTQNTNTNTNTGNTNTNTNTGNTNTNTGGTTRSNGNQNGGTKTGNGLPDLSGQNNQGSLGSNTGSTYDPFEPDYGTDEPFQDEPSGGGFFSVTTILLLMLVPILVGAGAWYILTQKKKKHDMDRDFHANMSPSGSSEQYPPLQLEESVPSGPMQTLMMVHPQQQAPHVNFDPVTLRKAKQYVASLRSQNIPDHKIARAMREADWPAAYIDESMKVDG